MLQQEETNKIALRPDHKEMMAELFSIREVCSSKIREWVEKYGVAGKIAFEINDTYGVDFMIDGNVLYKFPKG